MTADQLRAIIEAHARDEGHGGAWHSSKGQIHEHRGTLLDLLRAVAKTEPAPQDVCERCGRIVANRCKGPNEPHAPDCPAPALEALREP